MTGACDVSVAELACLLHGSHKILTTIIVIIIIITVIYVIHIQGPHQCFIVVSCEGNHINNVQVHINKPLLPRPLSSCKAATNFSAQYPGILRWNDGRYVHFQSEVVQWLLSMTDSYLRVQTLPAIRSSLKYFSESVHWLTGREGPSFAPYRFEE